MNVFKNKKFYQQGQTVIEYVLLVAMIATITMAIMLKLRNWLVGKSDCPNQSFICKVQSSLTGDGYLKGDYRYFKLAK